MSSLIFEDSGIDSEDKPTLEELKSSPVASATKHLEEIEVAFRGIGTAATEESSRSASVVVTQPLPASPAQRSQPPNTCRVLQRKLELKVERAKRNYCQQQHQQQLLLQEEQTRKISHTASMIPINRLPLPGGGVVGNVEQKPLVDYKSVSSDEEEDADEEISFFTAKLKNAHRQRKTELTDTFSIQEMTIDSELDSDVSDGSQNLELLPPMLKLNLLDRVRGCFNCANNAATS